MLSDETINLRKQIEIYLEEHCLNEAYYRTQELMRIDKSQSTLEFVTNKFSEITLENLGIKTLRIAFFSSFTLQPINQYLFAKCINVGIKPNIYFAGFNIFEQEILYDKSQLYSFAPDILFIALRLRDAVPQIWESFDDIRSEKVDIVFTNLIDRIITLIEAFKKRSSATIIIHNFETPIRSSDGIILHNTERGQIECIYELNSLLKRAVQKFRGVYIFDYEHFTSCIGKEFVQDDRLWYTSKLPLSAKTMIRLCEEYFRIILPLLSLNKKCLILDLDNTLWGGILGENGFKGIKIGETYPGIVFKDFQKHIMALYKRGIILTINSKNNTEEVMEVLDKHPDMILKREHFACMKINWLDKCSNIISISRELNIGLDSLVFVDDSPHEREAVRTRLPQVFVLDLPDHPLGFRKALRDLPFFDSLSLSQEDLIRNISYKVEKQRELFKLESKSLEEFYYNLEMKVIIDTANDFSLPRIAQLSQRTNQFNLTTIRYSEADIVKLIDSPTIKVFTLSCQDKFGDYGLVSVAIIRCEEKTLWIDSFFLSCRVIGKTVETAFLYYIYQYAKTLGVKKIIGEYRESPKNEVVRLFYQQHGFKRTENDNNAKSIFWIGNLSDLDIQLPDWIEIVKP